MKWSTKQSVPKTRPQWKFFFVTSHNEVSSDTMCQKSKIHSFYNSSGLIYIHGHIELSLNASISLNYSRLKKIIPSSVRF